MLVQDVINKMTEREKAVLKQVLSCQSDKDLKCALESVAWAAFDEYLEMLLGRQMPQKASEIRERRLYHLLKRFFKVRIPSELEISFMFQLPESSSRTLLRNTRTKYNFELEHELKNTVVALLSTAQQNAEGNYTVAVKSEFMLEELKKTVAMLAPAFNQIIRVKNSASVYLIPKDTFDLLNKHFGSSDGISEAAAGRLR